MMSLNVGVFKPRVAWMENDDCKSRDYMSVQVNKGVTGYLMIVQRIGV